MQSINYTYSVARARLFWVIEVNHGKAYKAVAA